MTNLSSEDPGPIVPPSPPEKSETHRLDRSLARGVAWTAGVKWTSQLLSWASTLIVARLLTPEDYGLVAMAMVFIGLVALVNEFGMGAAIVRHRDLSQNQINQINGLCVLFGLGAFAVSAAAAYPVSRLYNVPDMIWVVVALSLNFLITGFRTVPLAVLERDLDFRRVALNEGIQAIAQSALTVMLAVLGFKYWTLVFGSLLSAALSTVLACRLYPCRLAWPRRNDVGEAVIFGSHLVTTRTCWYVYSNADLFVAGKMLGQTAAGVYSIGMTLASLPVEKISAMVVRVAPAIFSAVQTDMARLRRYALQMTAGLALVTLPASIGMALVARDFVLLVLGENWRPAIVPLQLLCAYAAFRSIVPILPIILQIVGLSKFAMKQAVVTAIVLPVSFVIGSKWGINGIGWAWVIAYPVLTLPIFYVAFRAIGMRPLEYLQALWPAASSTLVMAIAVYTVQQQLQAVELGLGASFTVAALTGALTYPVALGLLHRSSIRSLREVVTLLRSR